MDSPVQSHRTSTSVVVALVSGIIIGIIFGSRPYIREPMHSFNQAISALRGGSTADFSILTQAWETIHEQYVKQPVDDRDVLRGAVSGMVNSLKDQYSFYLAPNAAKSYEDELNGKFSGIGAELGYKDSQIVVIAPLPGTPAEKAGIRSGDVIREIDGVETRDMSLEDAVTRIRGNEGSSVTLVVQREGQNDQTMKLNRESIRVQSVKASFEQSPSGSTVAIIKISNFTQDTGKEFTQAVQNILERGTKGIVIDLRNDPGGYLSSAVSVADAFLKDGTIVIEEYGNGKRDVTEAHQPAPLENMKVAVLVNRGTASAAEILAGALHDRLNAPIIGEKTFGKGSVQEIETMNDGSTMKLTVAHWLTPNGSSIDNVGISPTVEMKSEVGDNNDAEMQKAIQVVTQ